MARDCERRWTSSRWSRSLPVAVVDGRDGAGAHDALQLEALEPGDLAHRLLERDLHLGERRDRHPERQVGVEHVVLAHIAVGEHVVAERLRVAQAGAVAEHQPGMRPQHRDVVGDVLALDGPTPILIMVMPRWPGSTR